MTGIHITRLEINNVKKIRAVAIEPNGFRVVLGGKNGAGKSTVIDMISYLMEGAGSLPSEPLRRGTEKGGGKLWLSNGLVIERKIRKGKKSQLIVQQEEAGKGGTPILRRLESPQAVLDDLYGQLSFDPSAFTLMTDSARLTLLEGLLPGEIRSTIETLKTAYEDDFAQRTDVNRQLSRLEALGLSEGHEGAETVDTEALSAELAEIDATITESRELDSDLERANRIYEVGGRDRDRLGKELATAKDAVARAEEALATQVSAVALQKEARSYALSAFTEAETPDREPLQKRLSDAAVTNAEATRVAHRNDQRDRIVSLTKTSEGLTRALAGYKSSKAEALAAFKFPVPGLTFDSTGVRVKGSPWEQASEAERLLVSIGIGIYLNPKLKVLLIRNGSMMDEDSLKILYKAAAEADMGVWLEVVGDRADATLIIEDGVLRE